ncbi:MAG: alpha/beta hydrolase-fold protein [Pseudomonadota bacterium]|nr:alpha/beta hydrolase-fold protein [Pseudomonadota bacterium]
MPESVARTEMRFGTRLVTVYPAGPSAPAVYCSDYVESGEKVIEECRRLGAPAFSLITVSSLSWDADLSPWPHDPVVSRGDDFRGLAGDYLRFLLHEVIPYADSVTGGAPSARHIAGYSMAGLFAIWSLFETEVFESAAAPSGSLWYPCFRDFFMEHQFAGKPRRVYFSIGNRETRTRNQYMKRNAEIMKELSAECVKRGSESVFEENPGNHFVDSELRTAKGICWILGK